MVFPGSTENSSEWVCPISNLSVLSVSGKDAVTFLQGQLTCNVNEINEAQSSLGAFCNAKGRVVSTFLLTKDQDSFLLILPKALLSEVKHKLERYILRSAVTLTDQSERRVLIGLHHQDNQSIDLLDNAAPSFGTARQAPGLLSVSFPLQRSLIIAETPVAMEFWSARTKDGRFSPRSSKLWRYLDILSGLPWLSIETTEVFIPQTLNLDKLGGISFKKGCYTGQEIVARTHYLGKAKKEMFLAECQLAIAPEVNTSLVVLTQDSEEAVGRVLQAECLDDDCKMLIVLQISNPEMDCLQLKNDSKAKINLLTL